MSDDISPPGQGAFGPTVHAVDDAVDKLLERARGWPPLDALFSTASHVGDFSVVWHLIGAGRGIALGRLDQTVVLAALLGVESVVVNQGIKRLFRRERPTEAGDDQLAVRRPTTSSFPSGHASSAAFAATILIGWDGPRLRTLWITVAAIVGISRVYVRIHHASDVIGGALVGVALGLAGRRVAARLLASS